MLAEDFGNLTSTLRHNSMKITLRIAVPCFSLLNIQICDVLVALAVVVAKAPYYAARTTTTATRTPQNNGFNERKQKLCTPCACVLHCGTFLCRPANDVNHVTKFEVAWRTWKPNLFKFPNNHTVHANFIPATHFLFRTTWGYNEIITITGKWSF